MKNKTTAALLAIFLGFTGAHKFYLRDTGSGIFYIMLMIFSANLRFPISTILGWIDAFALLTMSEERFNQKYNSGSSSNGQRRNSRRETRTANRNPYQQRSEQYDYRSGSRPSNNNPYQNNERKTKIIKDNPFKTSGIKRLKDFELDLAEADLIKALELSPDDFEIHYELGKLFSMTEKKQKSYYHLAKAVQLGFKNISEIRSIDELAYLRVQSDFEEFENSGFRQVPGNGVISDIPQTPSQTNQSVEPPKNDLLQNDLLLSQLNKLQELRRKGLLSDSEFEEEKIKLMGR